MQHPKDDEQPDRADDTAKSESTAKADDAETAEIRKGKADAGKADTDKPAETKKPAPSPAKPAAAKSEPAKAEPAKAVPASEAKTQAIPVQKKGADPDAETTAIPKQTPPASEAKTEAIPVAKKPQPPAPRPAPNRPPQQTRPPQQRAQPQRVLPPQQSAPQRPTPPSGSSAASAAVKADANGGTKEGRSWRFAAIGAAIVVVLAIVIAGVVLYQQHAAENSPEAKVQRSIDTFVTALREGDLATLRTSTCGSLAEYYNSITPEEFANVHRVAMEQQSLPVVGAVDAIQFTDNRAIAQVSAHTTANPAEQSLRTFNLEKIDDTWKICNPPR